MMIPYYASRALASIVLAGLLAVFGMVWWGALLAGGVVFAAFIFLARSGRYVVRLKNGITPLRRDERAEEINRRAGLTGFVVLMVTLGAGVFYYGAIAHKDVPVDLLTIILLLGLAGYIITDYRLRKM